MLTICKTLYLSTLKQSCHLQDHHGVDYQDLTVIVSSDHQDALISDFQNSPTAVKKEVLFNKNQKTRRVSPPKQHTCCRKGSHKKMQAIIINKMDTMCSSQCFTKSTVAMVIMQELGNGNPMYLGTIGTNNPEPGW